MSAIRRGFADLDGRQVHYRAAGGGTPKLLLLHGAPGSSRQLLPLMEQLAPAWSMVAPDMPGYGDTPLPDAMAAGAPPDIADYAEATIAFLDAQGIGRVDVYGTHTGGAVAIEIAVRAPERVGRLVVDGLGHYSPAERDAHLAQYAPRLRPDRSGVYLTQAFGFLRDLFLFWPWYEADAAHRRESGIPEPAVLHALLVETLKAVDTYHLGYRASFTYPAAERLALVTQKTLLMAQSRDPLTAHTRAAAARCPATVFREVTRADAAETISAFLRVG